MEEAPPIGNETGLKNLRRILSCLQYSDATVFDPRSLDHVHRLVIWLEDRKIRACEVEERESLRNFSDQWNNSMSHVRSLCDTGLLFHIHS